MVTVRPARLWRDGVRKSSAIAVVLIACQGCALAQAASGKLTSQEKWKAFYAQVDGFRKQAKAAFDHEMARDKAGDCPVADTTRAIIECLTTENQTTTANYKTYAGALRSLLGITGAADADRTPGPTGMPLTSQELVSGFDETEAAWQKYREAQCKAAYNEFKGGTAAGPEEGYCELMLVRNHLREMERIYYVRLHN